MNYYDSFVKSSVPPRDVWKDSFQEIINKDFENAPTFYTDVEEEVGFGSLEFRPVPVRVNSLVDARSGQRVNDDYRKLIFQDLSYKPQVGTRYRFNNNIWIAYSTNNLKADRSSIYIRRCNNVMSTQNKYGQIHREPIYIDYKVTENQIFRNQYIDVPSGRIFVQCQYNDKTKDIEINDRFIFGKTAYKVRELNHFDRRYTFDESSSRSISMYLDYDNLAENDNLDLGVANYREYNFEIKTIDSVANVIGFETNLSFLTSVLLNGVDVDEDLIWTSSDPSIAQVDVNSGYTRLIRTGSCFITCCLKGNVDVSSIIDIICLNKIEDNFEVVISPKESIVKLNKGISYCVQEYNNGGLLDTKFEFLFSGLQKKHYSIDVIDGNNFVVTNLKQSELPLIVECINKSNRENAVFEIELGGIV